MSIPSLSCYNNNGENNCEKDFRIHNMLSLNRCKGTTIFETSSNKIKKLTDEP